MEMMPLKSHGKRKNYQGYFSTIFMWINRYAYDIKYIWYVISKVYLWWKESGITVNVGYFNKALQINKSKYNEDEVTLPYSASREELLRHGHTVDTLPFHLLTKEERKSLEGDVDGEQITDADRELFRMFLEKL